MIFTKFRIQFVDNFYLLFILVGLSQMLHISGGWTILSYLSFLFGLTVLADFKYSLCDFLVCFFIIYSLSTYFLFGDYPIEIFIASIRDQIFPISFYFFARSRHMRNCNLMSNAISPLMIAFIIGFFLFFTAPGWYISYRLNDNYNQTVTSYFNLTRMSSFWSSSYFVGYSSLFVTIYTINKAIFEKQKLKHFRLILLVSILTLFFALQRITLGFAAIYLCCIIFILLRRGKISSRSLLLYSLSFTIVVFAISILVIEYMDKYYLDFVLDRFVASEDGMVEDRINLFEKYITSISFWGDGLGKYSHNALLFDLPSITDCEYIRTPNEIGIFGMGLFLLISLLSFLHLIKLKKIFCFESFCLAFFLMAMIGATPLEVSQQQPFMLWYCIGIIQNYG